MRRRWLIAGGFAVVLLAAAGGAAWVLRAPDATAADAPKPKAHVYHYALASHTRSAKPKPVHPFGQPRTYYPVAKPGSHGLIVLRLQQLLAHHGYLPVTFHASGKQPAYMFAPRRGIFRWDFDPPPTLRAQWHPRQYDTVTRGAVMSFQSDNGFPVDGIAGPQVWRRLLSAKPHPAPRTYTYVLVSETLPESITIYQGSHTAFQAAANTGIPEAPTALGTYPVYLRYVAATMQGTNPDGSHYNDPGVPWISYFNGGDAVHGFPRSSYGSPQSLGCVELAYGDAAQAYKLMTYGTLVTVTA
jgi:peptidoglycan hydrolase-like protein with peptidoglycan-binding domain